MKKIVTIIGARPQIIKSAAISRAISSKYSEEITEIVVHTGQHYDENMSDVFFKEMGIPAPKYNLNVGSNSHGKQTAEMLIGIEGILIAENADALLVYGDTNSTIAGSLAASKLEIPIIHVEAGLRSFNKKMPEEINRIVCDHVSTLLFSPTKIGVENLRKEGFRANNLPPYSSDNAKVYHCGDIMYDNSSYYGALAQAKNTVLKDHGLEKDQFILCTIHRNNNTDDLARLTEIFNGLIGIMNLYPNIQLVLPLHPRTKNCINQLNKEIRQFIASNTRFKIIEPVSFLNITALEMNCKLVITDSGGLQKEAFFFEKPCVILRSETEWVEIVENGNAIIADANAHKIINGAKQLLENKDQMSFPSFYGDGHAAEFICSQILEHI